MTGKKDTRLNQRKLKRVVVKIGTNVLTTTNGTLDIALIAGLVAQVAEAKKEGIELLLVSSGAVGAGQTVLRLPSKLNPVTRRQVYASIGQVELMRWYTELFRQQGLHCAQVLATKEDFRDRMHFVNMKHCLLALLRDNIVPIINENDVISISELMFTDNDELASLTASLTGAGELIILTNVDGVLDENQEVIPVIRQSDTWVFEKVTAGKSDFGRGGMLTKLRVCRQAARLGIHTYIANGKKNLLLPLLRGEKVRCSYFPAGKKTSGIKHWMARNENPARGIVVINEGAALILQDESKAASLLPVGIVAIKKPFKKSDVIAIENEKGNLLGIGIAAYGSKKLKPLIGRKNQKEIIHYDYLLVY
ncbi:MAG TPA: glutamate 5-kinase [Bacteroidetes bacterium]|nr:glutamate 5-kinase [Bacteroidota bacterium]